MGVGENVSSMLQEWLVEVYLGRDSGCACGMCTAGSSQFYVRYDQLTDILLCLSPWPL